MSEWPSKTATSSIGKTRQLACDFSLNIFESKHVTKISCQPDRGRPLSEFRLQSEQFLFELFDSILLQLQWLNLVFKELQSLSLCTQAPLQLVEFLLHVGLGSNLQRPA